MREQQSVWPCSREILCTMAWMGVRWNFPPKGMSTVPAPMVESNRSERPWREQKRRSPAWASMPLLKLSGTGAGVIWGAGTETVMCFSAPLEFKNSREMSTMVWPFQVMVRRGSAFTCATTVASRFSPAARARNFPASSGATTTAMRSWDSLMASSVPSRPSYFRGTRLKSMSSPSASSPMATDTPPAPKSLQRLMSLEASGLRNRRWSFRSSGALPFWTSAPQVWILSTVWDLEEPVAPPQPSRPVRPPKRIT